MYNRPGAQLPGRPGRAGAPHLELGGCTDRAEEYMDEAEVSEESMDEGAMDEGSDEGVDSDKA